MALTFGFYDSLNHDRLYNAKQMSAIFDGIINDGVFASVGGQFHTVPGTGMQVLVKTGRAWFNSTWTLNDSELALSIDAADSLLGRIDTVVLEVNSEQATRANSIKVVKGTAASSPVKPTLTNTVTVHQHPLAYVTVAKGTTSITASMIEIAVGKTDCPYVTAILQTTDITTLFAKWENDFQTWFSTVRSTLDGDVALNLQNQIDANWRKTLRETTPPKIALPSTATPADMFDVLADVGDLHVWRKTVKTSSPINATYTIDEVTVDRTYVDYNNTLPKPGLICWTTSSCEVTASTSFTLDPITGIVTQDNPTIYSYAGANNFTANDLLGKYVRLKYPNGNGPANLNQSLLYYIPSDASITMDLVGWFYCDKLQYVNVTPYIPAGTHVTYPVSTNRNAYQEGSNAKPAGYTLGDAEKIILGDYSSGTNQYIKYSDSVSVTDTGVVSLSNISGTVQGNTLGESNNFTTLKGKFISTSRYGYDVIFFVPVSSTLTTAVIDGDTKFSADCQPVTGYPAIPADTVIEYLGCLGDKAMVQVLSYVGTGTYGVNNPTSLTFRFKPKIVFVTNVGTNYTTYMLLIPSALSATYTSYGYIGALYGAENLSDYYAKIEDMTVSYYSSNNYSSQANVLNVTYTVLAIG